MLSFCVITVNQTIVTDKDEVGLCTVLYVSYLVFVLKKRFYSCIFTHNVKKCTQSRPQGLYTECGMYKLVREIQAYDEL